MAFTVSLMKCGASGPLIMYVVFVAAEEYFCAMFESENIFGSSRLRWLENARGILFSAVSIAIFTSTRVTSLPEIWVKMADARAHRVVNGGEIV